MLAYGSPNWMLVSWDWSVLSVVVSPVIWAVMTESVPDWDCCLERADLVLEGGQLGLDLVHLGLDERLDLVDVGLGVGLGHRLGPGGIGVGGGDVELPGGGVDRSGHVGGHTERGRAVAQDLGRLLLHGRAPELLDGVGQGDRRALAAGGRGAVMPFSWTRADDWYLGVWIFE